MHVQIHSCEELYGDTPWGNYTQLCWKLCVDTQLWEIMCRYKQGELCGNPQVGGIMCRYTVVWKLYGDKQLFGNYVEIHNCGEIMWGYTIVSKLYVDTQQQKNYVEIHISGQW